MLNDPRDPGAYRIAIAVLGLALAVLLAGICWIAAVHVTRGTVQIHKTTVHVDKRDPVHDERVTVHVANDPAPMEMGHVPVELWFVLAALGGVFVGALIPFSWYARPLRPGCTCAHLLHLFHKRASAPASKPDRCRCASGCACEPDRYRWAWGSIAGALILLVVCIVAALSGHSLRLYALETTIVGVLLGLPIPSPGRRDP
jgi:hypothetical protein